MVSGVILRKRRQSTDIGEGFVRQWPTTGEIRVVARGARVIGGKKAWSTVAIVQLVEIRGTGQNVVVRVKTGRCRDGTGAADWPRYRA
jgi:hypothetical protein